MFNEVRFAEDTRFTKQRSWEPWAHSERQEWLMRQRCWTTARARAIKNGSPIPAMPQRLPFIRAPARPTIIKSSIYPVDKDIFKQPMETPSVSIIAKHYNIPKGNVSSVYPIHIRSPMTTPSPTAIKKFIPHTPGPIFAILTDQMQLPNDVSRVIFSYLYYKCLRSAKCRVDRCLVWVRRMGSVCNIKCSNLLYTDGHHTKAMIESIDMFNK
jgi:hypothetical protein